ncbi:CHAT domain-containing protein [Limnothrix redekei]|uniref:CHAT domain-containing protein n=1 Tax=Limnothrix redekei LRLZ20PSL1 TaxID=3112953 RepID=A0ABW7CB26_9CYAN
MSFRVISQVWPWLRVWLGFTIALSPGWISGPALADVVPADDGLGTIVDRPNDQQFNITGGSRSSSGTNLFHGFEQFDLEPGDRATFIIDPSIQNIFGRISSGDPSVIDGLVQMSGGSANLYLLNPAGIVFGSTAQVNVPGSFYATSANAVQFGLQWFNVFEGNDLRGLNGTPTAFAFSPLLAGSIVHDGTIQANQQVALLGGTVLSTGSIASGANAVTVVAVEGDRVVRIQSIGNILSFDIGIPGLNSPGNSPIRPADTGFFAPLNLPELLSGRAENVATSIAVGDDGTVQLNRTGETVALEPGAALVTGPVNGQEGGTGLQVLRDQSPFPLLPGVPNRPGSLNELGDPLPPDTTQNIANAFETGKFDPPGLRGELGDQDFGDRDFGDRDFGPIGPGEEGNLALDPGEFGPDRPLGPDGEFGPDPRELGPDGEFDPDPRELGPDGEFDPGELNPESLAMLADIEASNLALDASLGDTFLEGNFDSGLDQLESTWTQQIETYLGSSISNNPVSSVSLRELLSEIRQQTNSQTALVYVMLQEQQTDLVVITSSGEPIYRRSGVGRAEVLAAADRLRQAITNPVLRRGNAYRTAAEQLDRWLIAPIAPELAAQKIDTLLISPDVGLRSLPWAALHDGQQFLVQRFALGMTPSVNLTDARYVSLRDAPILAMGASEFPAGLSPLPAVPMELQTIAQERAQTTTFLNEAFTIANLQTQRQRQPAPILHLATHGEFKPGQPVNSYIQFWNQERLTLDRLRELSLNHPPVELLVLSACRTAVGDANAELGFAGLAVQAGVKSALASLWYVSDEGTLALMSEFYRQLSIAPTKSQALRQAQMAMIEGRVRVEGSGLTSSARGPIPLPSLPDNSGSLAHPYYWAAFVAIGSPW